MMMRYGNSIEYSLLIEYSAPMVQPNHNTWCIGTAKMVYVLRIAHLRGEGFCNGLLWEPERIHSQDLSVVRHSDYFLNEITPFGAESLYRRYCSMTAVTLRNSCGLPAQFQRLECSISSGVFIRAQFLFSFIMYYSFVTFSCLVFRVRAFSWDTYFHTKYVIMWLHAKYAHDCCRLSLYPLKDPRPS